MNFQLINQWFKSLNIKKQEEVLDSLSQGKTYFLDFLSEIDDEVHLQFINLFEYLNSEILYLESKKSLSILERMLEENGLTESVLAKRLIFQEFKGLKIYLDTKTLRESSEEEFYQIAYTIIKDIFIDRRYRSLKRLHEELALEHFESTRSSYNVLSNLLLNLYEFNFSFEELEEFMIHELKLQPKKVSQFLKLITEYRDGIERYFLFKQLAQIRTALDDIYAEV